MAVRKLKPTTPGQRHKIIGVFDDITKRTPEKSLTVGKRSTGGRNNEGHLTARYRGGGHRRKLRLRKLKPTTPGQRHKIIGVFDDITKRTPEKSLTVGKRSTGGRNNEGHLTARYRGGGHRRKLRLIDFKRNKDGVPAVVKAIEYDPNRSARIALLYYADGYKAYIIAPNGLEVGATIESGENVAPEVLLVL